VAEEIADEAIELGSADNVSLILIEFEPKLRKLFASSEKHAKKEKEKEKDKKVPFLFLFGGHISHC